MTSPRLSEPFRPRIARALRALRGGGAMVRAPRRVA